MEHKQENHHDSNRSFYTSGAEFWRETAMSYGLNEAFIISGEYLNSQLKQELPPEERQFCRELFAAMFEATTGQTDPVKLVYPYPVQEANEREERSTYFENRTRNGECARAIDTAISASCYDAHYYNLDIAAMTVIQQYGFQRVNAVLAHCFQTNEWDGRYSDANKQWAQDFALPEQAFSQAYLNAHPVLIEDFANHTRKLYAELGAERFALPGQPESGEVVEGYEITRAISFANGSGFAIAANPTAGFVCWQFKTDNGRRDYFWGHYSPDEKDVANRNIARVVIHMSDGTREGSSRDKASAAPQSPPQRKSKGREER